MADITKIKKAALVATNILDQEVRNHYHCTPMTGRKSNEAQAFAGGFCLVFPMIENGGSKKIGYRVWYIDNLNHQLLQIAKEVGRELPKIKLPYFVGYEYLDEAINVEGDHIPGVKMEWVEGETLDAYIKNHRSSSDLGRLADAFLTMCRDLTSAGISHGDLSNSNILVIRNGEIRLVDYDSLYLPTMNNRYNQTTTGQPAFQHPKRVSGLPMTEKDDCFSQLVIYLSLIAIASNTSLIDNIDDQELLFNNLELRSVNDFRNSRAYRAISSINDPKVRACLSALETSIAGPLSAVPSLVQVLDGLSGEGPKPISQVVMFRNKNYCPQCGTKYPYEHSAFCNQCQHPREVPKTW